MLVTSLVRPPTWRDHVAGPQGVTADGVLRTGQQPGHPHRAAHLAEGGEHRQHDAGAGHVPLHGGHAVGRLDREPAGVEGDALAHQDHVGGAPRRPGRGVAELDQAGGVVRGLPDPEDAAEAAGREVRLVPDPDAQVALGGHRLGHLRDPDRVLLVRGHERQLARRPPRGTGGQSAPQRVLARLGVDGAGQDDERDRATARRTTTLAAPVEGEGAEHDPLHEGAQTGVVRHRGHGAGHHGPAAHAAGQRRSGAPEVSRRRGAHPDQQHAAQSDGVRRGRVQHGVLDALPGPTTRAVVLQESEQVDPQRVDDLGRSRAEDQLVAVLGEGQGNDLDAVDPQGSCGVETDLGQHPARDAQLRHGVRRRSGRVSRRPPRAPLRALRLRRH